MAINPVPVSKQKGGLEIRQKAYQLYCELLELLRKVDFYLAYEETDMIGKSYRLQDAIVAIIPVPVSKQKGGLEIRQQKLSPPRRQWHLLLLFNHG